MSQDENSRPEVPSNKVRIRQDIVLKRFVEGMSVPAIVKYLDRMGIQANRDTPYQDITRATNERMLSYNPPPEQRLAERICERFDKNFRDVYVPSYGGRMATVGAAAQVCAEAIWSIAEKKAEGQVMGRRDAEGNEKVPRWPFLVRIPDPEGSGERVRVPYAKVDPDLERDLIKPVPLEVLIRVGFSGGHSMSLACRDLGAALARNIEDKEKALKRKLLKMIDEDGRGDLLPEKSIARRRFKVRIKLVFTNLLGGFDRTPLTNPIAYLPELLRNEVLAARTTVDIFNAMPFAALGKVKEMIENYPALKGIRKDALQTGFDVILTSGGCIDDPHGMFRRYYGDNLIEKYGDKLIEELLTRLIDKGVEGDFIWMPLTKHGPFNLADFHASLQEEGRHDLAEIIQYQPMALLDLEEIAKHVRKSRDVFLILGPCSGCGGDKARIGNAALGQDDQIVTHFFADKDTARAMLGENG